MSIENFMWAMLASMVWLIFIVFHARDEIIQRIEQMEGNIASGIADRIEASVRKTRSTKDPVRTEFM